MHAAHSKSQTANRTPAPRDHPAEEVFVTGTFDDWSKSVKLEKKAGYFEKLVQLPVADQKIDYKVWGSYSNCSQPARPLLLRYMLPATTFIIFLHTWNTSRAFLPIL